ncbi:MAG: thymidine phosphorylase [Acidobacteriota bacterium]|nr:thymidine phosphorylase [Acidobacteriota bacterium]
MLRTLSSTASATAPMVSQSYRILERKRAGMPLDAQEIGAVVAGATDGSWSDGQLGAFLMAAAIRGLDREETAALTAAMLGSGESWQLGREVPQLCDKHSTGGVGDKVSLVLAPLLASCGVPMAMLSGRGLGHTGGTVDKLLSIPGLDLRLDRRRCLDLVQRCGMANGMATGEIAPADRRLYALRDATATVDVLPLIAASIVSKKAALGAAAVVYDVKTGNGAFMAERGKALELARMLVLATEAAGVRSGALVTDMSQPLGRWAGHAAEVREALELLAGEGPPDLLEVTLTLATLVSRQAGRPLTRADLLNAIGSGRARERFETWAALQGADSGWLRRPSFPLAPVERPLLAARTGTLSHVDTRQLGSLLIEAGGGRSRPDVAIDYGVSLEMRVRLGEPVAAGEELARLYLRREDDELAARFAGCFTVADSGEAPELIVERLEG